MEGTARAKALRCERLSSNRRKPESIKGREQGEGWWRMRSERKAEVGFYTVKHFDFILRAAKRPWGILDREIM